MFNSIVAYHEENSSVHINEIKEDVVWAEIAESKEFLLSSSLIKTTKLKK